LPDAAVREARDRVRAAILSSGLPWALRRISANLAPSSAQNVEQTSPGSSRE
jgi:magnesium chelatase family protein